MWGGSQFAVDTTMVCPLSRDGVAQRGTATTDGKSLAGARRRNERTYPEFTGEHGRAKLVVLGVEVGGRWSAETSVFLKGLAAAKARGAPPWLGGQVRAAWLRKWQGPQLPGLLAALYESERVKITKKEVSDLSTHSQVAWHVHLAKPPKRQSLSTSCGADVSPSAPEHQAIAASSKPQLERQCKPRMTPTAIATTARHVVASTPFLFWPWLWPTGC